MIKDTSLTTELSFAVLPVILPINPRSGKIVKASKKDETSPEDSDSGNKRRTEREIDPHKKHVSQENIEILVLENNIRGRRNNSGYYVFSNLPPLAGYTLFMKSTSYLTSRCFVNMEEFDPNRSNPIDGEIEDDNVGRVVSSDRSIIACVFEKILLKNTEQNNLFIKSIIVYPSKKTILRVIINKANITDFSFDYAEKPIQEAELLLRKKMGGEVEDGDDDSHTNSSISPDSILANEFTFSSLDEIPQVVTFEGTYDEAVNSFLGRRKFINLPDQNDGKFELIIRPAQTDVVDVENTTDKKLAIELKIEKANTTLINILIID